MKPASLKDFENHYFYKTDLQALCKEFGLPTNGTKAELNSYIRRYLQGTPANQIRAARHKTVSTKEPITLDTKIVGEGFAFNSEARQLFAEYLGIKKFSFKKDMAILKRSAESRNDTTMTVRDLLNAYILIQETGSSYKMAQNTDEEATYQWNNFVKAFCSSEASNRYTQKLKAAALLWRHVRDSDGDKQFKDQLITEYANQLKPFE